MCVYLQKQMPEQFREIPLMNFCSAFLKKFCNHEAKCELCLEAIKL